MSRAESKLQGVHLTGDWACWCPECISQGAYTSKILWVSKVRLVSKLFVSLNQMDLEVLQMKREVLTLKLAV